MATYGQPLRAWIPPPRRREGPARSDEVSIRDRFFIVHIGIGRYCGAGVCLTPEARIDDGLFDVCLVMARSKLKAALQWGAISQGVPTPDVSISQGRRVRVWGPRGFVLHADGEVRTAPTGVLDATVVPGAIRVVTAL